MSFGFLQECEGPKMIHLMLENYSPYLAHNYKSGLITKYKHGRIAFSKLCVSIRLLKTNLATGTHLGVQRLRYTGVPEVFCSGTCMAINKCFQNFKGVQLTGFNLIASLVQDLLNKPYAGDQWLIWPITNDAKKPEKWLKSGHMDTHQRVLIERAIQ